MVYLAGSIDCSPDFGKGWREEIKSKLKQEGFGLGILSPLSKPVNGAEEDEHLERKTWDKNRLSEKMKKIRATDLRLCDKSDFLIVRIDKTPISGTYEELYHANKIKRPILIWADEGCISDWLYGTIPHRYFFYSLEDLIDYLRKVDSGAEDDNRRWIFFDWSKVEYL